MECELGWLPTFCAGVVLGPIWIMKFEIKSGCLDFVGVALGVILRVELELESGYIHVVLVSHWV